MCLSVLLATFIYIKKKKQTLLTLEGAKTDLQNVSPQKKPCVLWSLPGTMWICLFKATHLVITHQPARLFLEYFHCLSTSLRFERVNYLIRLQSTLGSLEKVCHVNIYK